MQGGENKSESELERQVDNMMELGRDEPAVNVLSPKEASPSPDNASFDDKLTEKAIDDITRSESDELLDSEDSEDNLPLDPTIEVNDHPHRKLKITIWSIVLVLIGLGAAYLIPTSRFWAFNLVGLRAKASLLVVDSVSHKPIDGVRVELGGVDITTDKDGRANLSNVKLGISNLTVSRLAYAPLSRKVTVDLGSNQFGQISLDPVVVNYKVNIKNAISGQPITGATVEFLDRTAESDLSGQAVLPLKGQQADNLKVKLAKVGFNNKTVTLNSKSVAAVDVHLTPEGRDYYIGEFQGEQGVVSVNLDGSEPKLVFSAGKADISTSSLSVSPDGQFVAATGTSGNGDESLVIINTTTRNYQFLARGDGIKFYGWMTGNVVYAIGSKCQSDVCYRLNLTNVRDGSGWEPSGFVLPDTVALVQSGVVYATAQSQGGTAVVYLANSDGTDLKQITTGDDISKIERVSPDDFLISMSETSSLMRVSNGSASSESNDVDTKSNRQFIDSPDGDLTAWVSQSGGKSNLVVRAGNGQPKTAYSGSDTLAPLGFVGDNYLIFRQQSGSNTTDYVYSISSGKTAKIVSFAG